MQSGKKSKSGKAAGLVEIPPVVEAGYTLEDLPGVMAHKDAYLEKVRELCIISMT